MLAFLGKTRSRLVQAAIALLCPRLFLRAWLRRHLPRSRAGQIYGLTISFDVETEADIEALPSLLALLRQEGWKASFAVIGAYVRRHPAAHCALADAGHELINHTHGHPPHRQLSPDRRFACLDREAMRAEIAACHAAIAEICGKTARVFRTPHFGDEHTAAAYAVLRDLGYAASSSQVAVRSPAGGLPYAVECPTGPVRLYEFPLSTCPYHPHAVFDTWHCLQRPRPWHAGAGQMVAALSELVAIQRAYGGYVNLYFDPAAFVNYPQRDNLIAVLRSIGQTPRTYGELLAAGDSLGV